MRGATVTVSQPDGFSPARGYELRTIAVNAADNDGLVRIDLAEGDLPGGSDTMNLELDADPADSSTPLIFNFQVGRDGANGQWTTDLPSDAVLRAGQGLMDAGSAHSEFDMARSQAAAAAAGPSTINAPAGEDGAGEEEVETGAPTAPAGRGTSSSATDCPPGYTGDVTWWPLQEYRYPYVPTKLYKTTKRSSMTWTHGASRQG